MMCYKDKSFCVHSEDCSNTGCNRNLTESEKVKAIDWWGGLDFPISFSDFKSDTCGFIQFIQGGKDGIK